MRESERMETGVGRVVAGRGSRRRHGWVEQDESRKFGNSADSTQMAEEAMEAGVAR